jgi:acyl carrier protein
MNVEQQIRQFVVSNLMFGAGNAEPAGETSLMEAGILDSTGVLELVLFVGQTFGVDVPVEDVVPEHFDSISGLASYVSRRLSSPCRAEPETPQSTELPVCIPTDDLLTCRDQIA